MSQVLITPVKAILTHSRFILTLRSEEGKYHGLILFRLSPATVSESSDALHDESRNSATYKQIYVMESTCPHLGAEMSHADIEEYEDSVVAVCPWHRYDFDLKTGKSDTGLQACTYSVEVNRDSDGIDQVYMEAPREGTNWRVVELRPVSEEFADPPPPPPTIEAGTQTHIIGSQEPEEPVVPLDNPPKTLTEWAVLILNTPNPILKVERTRYAVQAFRTGKITSIGHKTSHAPRPPDCPTREAMITVDPGKVMKRKNRAVMLHALANIEQWAIDLAWDIMARFGPMHKDLPPAFFSDFAKMALDESKHFALLRSRLSAISPSTPYGSMPVHASLWESATVTSKSFRSRLAIIHLVHEARGLDVNPATIERFRKAGDTESVKVMEIIHADEVTHVTAGHRWFTWICEKEGNVDPVKAFREEVRMYWRGDIKGPFNAEDREKAGLSREFYKNLRGEMPIEPEGERPQGRDTSALQMGSVKEALADIKIEYDSITN